MKKRIVLIRGVDEEVYRRAKAAAALRGISVGRAASEALAAWAKETQKPDIEREVDIDRAFLLSAWEKLKANKDKAVVIADGRLQGVFETYEEARAFCARFRVALVFVVKGVPVEREIEIGPELEV